MSEHRYILEPYKGMNTRHRCPSCQQKDKTFSLYIDTVTGEHIHSTVGRCNREANCNYHYTPKQYFQDNNISFETLPKEYNRNMATHTPKPTSFIPVDLFKASLKGYEANNFVKFLIVRFGVEVASSLISKYLIGTSKHWTGANVFWQMDLNGLIRTGKIMLYNPETGKRIKEPFYHFHWVHKAIKQPEFELKQCLFGAHLLTDKTKPIALVESEKTSIIASVYFPQLIWLATGGLSNLNIDKCNVLKGRNVILYPDLKCFEKWSSKAKELSNIGTFTVSDLLERKASDEDKKQGFDIADYLLKFNPEDFKATPPPETRCNALDALKQHTEHIKQFFDSIELSDQNLINCSLIATDYYSYMQGKTNGSEKIYLPYLERLTEIKEHIQQYN